MEEPIIFFHDIPLLESFCNNPSLSFALEIADPNTLKAFADALAICGSFESPLIDNFANDSPNFPAFLISAFNAVPAICNFEISSFAIMLFAFSLIERLYSFRRSVTTVSFCATASYSSSPSPSPCPFKPSSSFFKAFI